MVPTGPWQELHRGMHDITERVEVFREAARHLWNTAFWPTKDWDDVLRFDAAYKALFEALVLAPMGIDGVRISGVGEAAPEPIECLYVRTSDAAAVPILIDPTCPPSGQWNDPPDRVQAASAELQFAGFYDFVGLGRRDLHYVQVVITRFDGHPDLVGRLALLDFSHCRVLSSRVGRPYHP